MFVTKKQLYASLLLFTVGGALLLLLHFDIRAGSLQGFFEKSLESYAGAVIAACADAEYKPTCYDREIPKLMDHITFEEAFRVTRIVQNHDDEYWYCHVLGHNISARETAKDPSKWTDVIARSPSGVCSNGSLHGAFQERFRGAQELTPQQVSDILPELRTICEDSDTRAFTGLERASCYHALGHLTMYITDADPTRAVDLCDRITANGREDHRAVCYDGVYMQIFQPLEPEDFALIEDIAPETQEGVIDLCNRYEGDKRASCFRESWPMFEDELETSEGIVAFCSRMETDLQTQRCYNGVFYIQAPKLNFEVERIDQFCEGLAGSVRQQCYAYSASRMIETDYRLQQRAVALCTRAQEHGVGERCWRELLLYSTFNFTPDSEAFERFCELLPGDLRERCFNKEGYSIDPYSGDL